MRADMDMLIRSVIRRDHTVDAMREDIKTLWLSQADLGRRIEALEEAGRSSIAPRVKRSHERLLDGL